LLENVELIRLGSRVQVLAEGSPDKMWCRRSRKATLAPVCRPSWSIDGIMDHVMGPVVEVY
jgi:hypothetical protein